MGYSEVGYKPGHIPDRLADRVARSFLLSDSVRQRKIIIGKPPVVEQRPSARSGQVLGHWALPTRRLRGLISRRRLSPGFGINRG